MVQRHSRRGVPEGIPVQVFAAEVLVEITGQVVVHPPVGQAVVRVDPVGLTEGVVQRGVDRAGGNQGAEFGNRLRKVQVRAGFRGKFEKPQFQVHHDVDGMTAIAVGAGVRDHAFA